MRAVLEAGGNHETRADIRATLKTGDKATGVNELMDLYEKMRLSPMMPDLRKLWRDLGIRVNGRTVEFDNDAPLAKTRQTITKPPSLRDG